MIRQATYRGSTALWRKTILAFFFAGSPLRRPGWMAWKQFKREKESLDIPLGDHLTTLPDPHTASSRLVSAGSAVIFLFITLPVLIRINVLFKYNMWIYMMLTCYYFLFKIPLLKSGCLSRYASICQGLHHAHITVKKSEHLHGSSAPRTYSIICISSESCLGSIVLFARLLCFGTLSSVLSAKVALGEPLRLRPG